MTTYQMNSNGGFVGRVWLVSVQDGALQNRQLIKEFGHEDTTHDHRIYASVTQRNHALIGVDEGEKTHLWHYDYATTGVFRHIGGMDFMGRINDMVTVGTKVFWSIAGEGLARISNDNVSAGYVISPLADNFTRDLKSWSGIIVDAENLGVPAKIRIYYSTNPAAIYDPTHPAWVLWTELTTTEMAGVVSLLNNVSSRYITIKVELDGDANDSPILNGFTVLSSPGQSDIFYNLPINVSDVITRPNHAPKTVPGLGRKIHNQLKTVQGASVTLEVLDPAETIQGTVMQINEPVIHYPRRGSPVFIAQVQIRGRTIPSGGIEGVSFSSASFGIGRFAEMFFGGREVE